MDSIPGAEGVVRRPRWRAYLLLSRISNLPTVWSNVLAAMVASSVPVAWSGVPRLAVAVSCFYTGGMFLNDAFDASWDRAARASRPIPAGDASRGEAFGVGAVLLAAGELLLVRDLLTLAFGLALAGAIVLYNYRHKGSRVAPAIMGACRGLVYCTAAAAWGHITPAVLVGAAVMTCYVTGLSVFAKMAGPRTGWFVPVLIAGVSLVDAGFIAAISPSTMLAVVAALGFPLTMAGQRFVPGN
jgi:4-hydroxybenzoate polyprenyltransferase